MHKRHLHGSSWMNKVSHAAFDHKRLQRKEDHVFTVMQMHHTAYIKKVADLIKLR
ncbi:hypothetical protein D918_09620 [Trichuris suis]|nr:hypothetical protein D918_09620 [Trichuris suis]